MALRDTFLFSESWNVAFRKAPCGTILSDTTMAFTVIKNAFRYWAADPFVVEHAGRTYVFAELYDYLLRRGVIGYCEISDKKITKWKPIIAETYHLSYPCVMMRDGKIWIMPESGQGRCLTVYESERFPNVWKKKNVIREDVSLADTTPLYGESSWAITHQVEDAYAPQLLLIDLSGNDSDKPIDNAVPFRTRPAGKSFVYNDQTVRPAQLSEDCGEGYGKALIFYQYKLNEDSEYRETEIKQLFPEELQFDRKIVLNGMHTYNASERYEVIDIKTKRFNLLDFCMRLLKYVLK